jgi:hypothetical protein
MALIQRKIVELKNLKSPNKTLSWGPFPQPQLRRGQDGNFLLYFLQWYDFKLMRERMTPILPFRY